MNKLTTTGLVGTIFFLTILIYHIKIVTKRMKVDHMFFFLLAMLSIISYGLIKNLTGREAWYAFFVVIPGLYYLPIIFKPVPKN
jgi:hypothetical protein